MGEIDSRPFKESETTKPGTNFLIDLKKAVEQEADRMTCKDIWNTYWHFWNELHRLKGNAHGFYGLSELIIWYFVGQMIGGVERNSDESCIFHSIQYPGLEISQSKPLELGGKKYSPDIVLFKERVPAAIIQVKIYLTNGIEEAKKELKTLGAFRNEYGDLCAMLIIYAHDGFISGQGKVQALLDAEKSKGWFDYAVLECDERIFWDVMHDGLGLEQFLT